MNSIAISLAGHTNNGKTTLARTLLRRDIGIVDDKPHVTDVAEGHVLQGDDDARIIIWDLPGFGDSIRLRKRLGESGLKAWLANLFDRWRDRPLWCSQKCLENVKQDADVVLYLVEAGADPEASAEVHAEMEVLAMIGKPVVLLLNQTGHPDDDRDDVLAKRWLESLKHFDFIRAAMALDGWMRCWLQESMLFQQVSAILPQEKRADFDRLIGHWQRANHQDVFERSVAELSRALAETARDEMVVGSESLVEKAAALLTRKPSPQLEVAKRNLRDAWVARTKSTMERLLEINRLDGTPREHVDAMLDSMSTHKTDLPPEIWGMLGAVGVGALAGLLADIKAGGMTFGGGAVAGGFLGGISAYALGRGYQKIKGDDGSSHLKWSKDFLTSEWKASGMRYLVLAHFGRGKGAWSEPMEDALPIRWNQLIDEWTRRHPSEVATTLKQGSDAMIQELLERMIRDVLRELYPRSPMAKSLP